MEHYIEETMVARFADALAEDEKCEATITKYIRDVNKFFEYINKMERVTKQTVIGYKKHLIEHYEAVTVNSILAAINSFFKKMEWYDCVVKSLKIQKDAFRSPEKELTKEEYYRLLTAAKAKENTRLYLLMQTICSTGIRVSELRFVTVEAVKVGQAKVYLKGKNRTIILPLALCRSLKHYAKENHIETGSIFITRNGHPMDRSNIFREMKSLCELAGVEPGKVFPHNLRHLFACTYYQKEKDIAHLADLLGHSNVNTTRIYLMKSSDEEARQIEKLGLIIKLMSQQNICFVVTEYTHLPIFTYFIVTLS